MDGPFFRTGYNYDTNKVSDETGLMCLDESLTVQSERDDADINVLVKRFGLVGNMPASPRVPTFGDFTGVDDYRTALDLIREADAAFMEMTPEVRGRFSNDPQKLMDFCSSDSLSIPENLKLARELGLVPKEAAVPAPLKVEVINPPPVPPISK